MPFDPSDPPPRTPVAFVRWMTRRLRGTMTPAVILALIAVLVGQWWTAGPSSQAQRFLRAAAIRGPASAYGQASPRLRTSMDLPTFARLTTAGRVAEMRDSRWTAPDETFVRALLSGFMILRDGGRQPVRMELALEWARWRVASVSFPGVAAPSPAPVLAVEADRPLRPESVTAVTPSQVTIAHPPTL